MGIDTWIGVKKKRTAGKPDVEHKRVMLDPDVAEGEEDMEINQMNAKCALISVHIWMG